MEREKMLKTLIGDSPTKADFVKAFKAVLAHMLRLEKKLEEKVLSTLSAAEQRLTARIAQIQKGRDGADGKNGRDGVNGRNGTNGVNGISGKDGSPDTGEDVVGKINADKSGKVIKKEHVEGLKEIEEIARVARATSSSGARPVGDSVYFEDLSAQTNGSTKAFTIPQYRTILAVFSSDFPGILMSGNGFTSVQGTLTLSVSNAPSQGSQLGMLYVL